MGFRNTQVQFIDGNAAAEAFAAWLREAGARAAAEGLALV